MDNKADIHALMGKVLTDFDIWRGRSGVTEDTVAGRPLAQRPADTSHRGVVLLEPNAIPNRILVRPAALQTMHLYTALCRYEIGWLGTTLDQPGCIVVDNVFLFDQEVTEVTADLNDEAMARFAHQLLTEHPDGVDILSRLRLWGHSHVNMAVTPSFQDDRQMDEFASSGHDYMIRCIANKAGQLRFDIFHFSHGVALLDVPWEVDLENEAAAIRAEIEAKVARRAPMKPLKASLLDMVRQQAEDEAEDPAGSSVCFGADDTGEGC